MSKTALKILLISQLSFSSFAMAEVKTVQKYTLNFSQVQSSSLQNLKSPAVGSGLVLLSSDANQLNFMMLTDRGPNIEGKKIKIKGEKAKESTIFPVPEFSPLIVNVVVRNGSANVTSVLPVLNEDGSRSSGLPQSSENSAIAVDHNSKTLGTKEGGIDPEAITVTEDGSIWIAEEYAPSLIKVDQKTGRIIKRLSPGNGLPLILSKRQENRGFEALSTTNKGELLAALQSTLDIDNKTKSKANFIRFVKIDLRDQKTTMYAYPISDITDAGYKAVKIGDLAFVAENKFIAIEAYKNKSGTQRARIVLLDFTSATDITDSEENGVALELTGNLSNLNFISKKEILDLGTIGWDNEKTEGLTILPDLKTIVISNDNDFGYDREKTNDKTIRIKEKKTATDLWMITFKDEIA